MLLLAALLLIQTLGTMNFVEKYMVCRGLSYRVLGLRRMGCGFEPHQRHCILSLSKTHESILSTGKELKQTKINIWF